MTSDLSGWRAPAFPPHSVLEGRWARLEPLDAQRHVAELEQAFAGADEVWTYLGPSPPRSRDDWLAVIAAALAFPNSRAWAVRDLRRGVAAGFLCLLDIRPAHGVAEIGNVSYSPLLQRTPAATEAVYLLLKLLFDAGYRRVEWKCDAANAASRRAAVRYGFVHEGLFRQHMVRKGRNRDTAWYAMLDGEWPRRRAAIEAWLAPGNFDAEGRQRERLARAAPPG
ncbi:GNAT family N-acetyltransferase [Camelimonas abortus]|uniref:GNAT family N-acetyltransferase n=1 Tax=Camelimonas abortus TaxID=1017184 RepID=A0ABV7LB42_9HYPH